MLVTDFVQDLIIIGVFLLVGFAIREFIPALQKIFLPACVIAGVLALVLGQQVIGIIELPSSFSSYSGALNDLVMCSLVFGAAINREKFKQQFNYAMAAHSIRGMQWFIGVIIGLILALFWVDLPAGWGLMPQFAFYGAHGNVIAAATAYENLGVTGTQDIGLVLATFGVIASMTIGMAIVNWGLRKGYGTYVKDVHEQPKWFYRGPLPEEQRKPIGKLAVNGASINGLALQFSLLALSMLLAQLLRKGVIALFPSWSSIPTMLYAVVAGVVVWVVIKALKLDGYVDAATIRQITGFILEIMIFTAVATVSLNTLAQFWAPMLIITVIIIALTVFWSIFLTKRYFQAQWFEACVMLFGRGTGVAANGMALVRAMDPNSQCDIAASEGLTNLIAVPFSFTLVLFPTMMIQGRNAMVIFLTLAYFVVPTILLILFGRKKNHAKAAEGSPREG